MKEWLACWMDVCSSYKYGSDIGKAFLSIKNYFYRHQNITIIVMAESETCPISEIATIILSLKFTGTFEAAAFPFINFFSRLAALDIDKLTVFVGGVCLRSRQIFSALFSENNIFIRATRATS